MATHYYNYLPFGEVSVSQNTTNYKNVYRFSAKELDDETQLSYFGARYYDARLSYWLSVDPLWGKTLRYSPYHYVRNNPLNRFDPDGRTDYKVDGETKTINDGHNNVSKKVTAKEFEKLQNKFNKNSSAYEQMMNKMSKQNGFTTYESNGDGVSITTHKAGGQSYGEWSMNNTIVNLVNNTNTFYGGAETALSTQAYRRALLATTLSAQLDGNCKLVNQMDDLSKRFKFSSKVKFGGSIISALQGVYDVHQGYNQDGGQFGYNSQRAALGSGMGIAGGAIGAEGGAAIGGAIGACFVGVGAVPGAIIGGLIGGVGGGMAGQSAGEAIIDEIHN